MDTPDTDRATVRPFDPRDHAGKAIVVSPLIGWATVIGAALAVRHLVPAGTTIPPVLMQAGSLLSFLTAACGSAAGGLMIRGTVARRVLAAIVAGVFGIIVYSLLCLVTLAALRRLYA